MSDYKKKIIRIIDFLGSLIGIVCLSPLIIGIFFLIYIKERSPFFYQERVGKNMKKFILIKFRTMSINTENCATHLVDSSKITKIGKFLRKTKLDEIPQLFNVLKGEMSFVGPRPSLPSQVNLIELRNKYNLYQFLPGITGLAQIKKIDMSDPILLANTDHRMMSRLNLKYYFYYIFMTIFGRGLGDRISKN
tara:strand:+ start:612 stop:1187 length:576 start_codon:yes stop_codon:yes gene_type:complete